MVPWLPEVLAQTPPKLQNLPPLVLLIVGALQTRAAQDQAGLTASAL